MKEEFTDVNTDAIVQALVGVIEALNRLGTNGADTKQGAIELVAGELNRLNETALRIAEALERR